MARIGDYINPSLAQYDPSPYLQAQQRATSVIGGSIASGIGAVGDAIEDRKQKKDTVKTSKELAKAMATLYPEAAGALEPVISQLDDEEMPLSQRAALGSQIGEFINLGVQKSRDNALMNLEVQRLGLDERRVAIAEAMPQIEREQAMGAAVSENDIQLNDALSRYTAIAEMEAPLADKLPEMKASQDLISKYIEQGDGQKALNAVESYEKARIKQMEPLMEPGAGPRLTKIGGTDAFGRPIEKDVFVTPQGGLFDISGQPLNQSVPIDGTVLPPRSDVPQEQERRIQPMPQTQLGVRPVRSITQSPEELQQIRRGEMGDKRLADVQAGANSLADNLPNLYETKALLEEVRTGFGADTITKAQRMFPGVDVSKREQLQTLLGDQVMARIGQTKGAVSEKEMDLFTQYSANFGKTTEGNKRIINFAIKAAERAKKISAVIDAGMESGKTPFEINREVKAIQDAEPLESTLGGAAPTPQDAKTRLQGIKNRLNQ
jgi:hypothetical protein